MLNQRKNFGYTNLKLHLDNQHDGWRQRFLLQLQSATDNVNNNKEPTLNNYFTVLLSGKAKNIYGWMNLIINNHLPFSVVENKTYRLSVKFDPIAVNTLIK